MKLIIDIPEKVVTAIQNGEDYRFDIHTAIAQGKPYEKIPQGDLISRSALKKTIMYKTDVAEETWEQLYDSVLEDIDNAPSVARTDRPFVCIEGKVIYITQGHIDALLKYERNERLKEYVEEFKKSLDPASEMGDGGVK